MDERGRFWVDLVAVGEGPGTETQLGLGEGTCLFRGGRLGENWVEGI